MSVGSQIKKRRKELGWTLDELAEKTGYRYRTGVDKVEKDQVEIGQTKIMKFADALGVPVRWLFEEDDSPPPPTVPLHKSVIPILGSISCGKPVFAQEEHGEYIDAGDIKADFGLYANGDSMINARIHDGDLVLVKQCQMVNDGEIAVVLVDDETTLKRFYYYPDNDLVILKAENPAYKDQIYQGQQIEQIQVLGKAVGVQFRV